MVKINLTNKWLYTLIAIGVILILEIGIYAYNSGQPPVLFGHSGGEVDITINSQTKTLQQAIDNGDLLSSSSRISDGISGKLVKNISFNSGANGGSSCILLTDGTVKCTGRNTNGVLGIGDASYTKSKYTDLSILSNVREIYGDQVIMCVLFNDNTGKCWGYNGVGTLGVGDTIDRHYPSNPIQDAAAGNLQNIKKLATRNKGVSAGSFICALITDNTVKCWGYNGNGQLGVGDQANRNKATTVASLSNVKDIELGGEDTGGFACALINDGTVKCWGYNGYGQLGVGDTTLRTTPTQVLDNAGGNLINVADIELNGNDVGFVCALITDGTVKCWGRNLEGQLGVGDTTQRTKATTVLNIGGANPKAIKLYSIDYSICALLEDKTVKCWGYNTQGQLGTGDLIQRNAPATAVGVSNAIDIKGGGHNNRLYCALINDGTMKCWGYNGYGELGLGDQIASTSTPTTVIGLFNVQSFNIGVEVDGHWVCATLTDKTLKCWGSNAYGELGTGDTSRSYLPIRIY